MNELEILLAAAAPATCPVDWRLLDYASIVLIPDREPVALLLPLSADEIRHLDRLLNALGCSA